MTLPKHLRPRWRYLAVALESWPDAAAAGLDRAAFAAAVDRSARALLGDPGAADARLDLVDFAFEAGVGRAIVRVRRGEVTAARAAVACVSRVAGQPVGVAVVGASGTLRACRRRYGDLPSTERTTVVVDGEEQTATVREEPLGNDDAPRVTLVDRHPPDGRESESGSDDEAFTGATRESVDD